MKNSRDKINLKVIDLKRLFIISKVYKVLTYTTYKQMSKHSLKINKKKIRTKWKTARHKQVIHKRENPKG